MEIENWTPLDENNFNQIQGRLHHGYLLCTLDEMKTSKTFTQINMFKM